MKDLNNSILYSSIEENIKLIKNIFNNDDTLQLRRFENTYNGMKCCIFFIVGMVDTSSINENILRPILSTKILLDDIDHISYLASQVLLSDTVTVSSNLDDVVNGILIGDTVLFVENHPRAIVINTKGWEKRNIEEPPTEKILRGPREGFTESLTTNLTLIRRKIQSKDLKFKFLTVGSRTNTKVCICYIEGLAKDEIINTVTEKIRNISIDGIYDIKYIQEFIDENPFSIFETTSNTEKPDIAAGKLLEGRIVILVNGSPIVATLPSLFIEHMMAGDDYYLNYFFASIGRMIRIWGFILTISVPALYLSLISFHQEIVPTPLLLSIYTARKGVPFPTFFELCILLAVFEVLREAGARVPDPIGQSISIVGALVLGSAAVEARFVSAPMIIIVGITAITSLLISPITSVVIILRAYLLLLSALLGIYGYILGMISIVIHLFSLRSYGIPYMDNLTSIKMQSLKDTFIRAPLWYMRYRPKFMSKDSKRENLGGKGDE
ncbi:spore germination protein [Tissierella sp. Yu-01]|uniref:spore germination protein n=1 Tax=Tissierella sp. Yu-01 TaxID=3035694 RepID=UPI00240D1A3A|nr:spore germination protein [Tissierella sp. Yu-01]WFA08630.1 spore germination protein [Tissierella sp. Yu-01]